MKKIVVDLDGTLTHDDPHVGYPNKQPRLDVVSRLKEFSEMGYIICVCTARNMRTYSGNIGKITANTVPEVIDWLKRHDIPFDELVMGKPWCGTEGFYVDDRAIRPDEFVNMTRDEISQLLTSESEI